MKKTEPKRANAFMAGNEAIAMGAIYAGVNFYAGYPITPSSEVAAVMSLHLPHIEDGVFIQMEDEAASLAACLGASLSGRKVLTATSGPGFSLMQELIGYGCMAEVPVVIANVQRGGPSTGLPTQVAQADVMQARWGTHGDHAIIVYAPTNVEECYTLTIKAVNMAEKYRNPVILLTDEVLAHSRESFKLPTRNSIPVLRRKISVPAKPSQEHDPHYMAYKADASLVPPMAEYGNGIRSLTTGLTHDERGHFTTKSEEVTALTDRLHQKIYTHLDDIVDTEDYKTEDADLVFISYGTAARTCGSVVDTLRASGVKAGLLMLKTLWPFPDERVRDLCKRSKEVYVVEMNRGQIILEVQRVSDAPDTIKGILQYDGYCITPHAIIENLRRQSRLAS